MSVLTVLDPFVQAVYRVLTQVADLLHPLSGCADAALALVVLTLLVRVALLPLTPRMVRAERARRALAPETARLRKRFTGNPQRLAEEMLAAHRRAGITPLAGLVPTLTQALVMLVVYQLARVPVIAGVHNIVFTATLFGAPLTGSLAALSMAGTGMPVVVAVVVVVLCVATFSSRRQRARLGPDIRQVRLVRLLPYSMLISAALVPLALTLVLVTSAAWTLAERAVLQRA